MLRSGVGRSGRIGSIRRVATVGVSEDRPEQLTDESIVTTRRDALRRLGGFGAAIAFGGIAAACGNESETATTTTTGSTPDVAGATLRRPAYTGAGSAGSDADVNRQADVKGDSDVTRIGDPPTDSDITRFADPVGSGTDSDPFDPIGGGTDSDITVFADPVGDGDVTVTADAKGDADVTRVADPVGYRS